MRTRWCFSRSDSSSPQSSPEPTHQINISVSDDRIVNKNPCYAQDEEHKRLDKRTSFVDPGYVQAGNEVNNSGYAQPSQVSITYSEKRP